MTGASMSLSWLSDLALASIPSSQLVASVLTGGFLQIGGHRVGKGLPDLGVYPVLFPLREGAALRRHLALHHHVEFEAGIGR